MKLLRQALIYIFIIQIALSSKVYSQCGSLVPSFTVDLTARPDTVWTSPDTLRADTCCGALAPDKCVKFVLNLHPKAVGIKFDICDGAVPPGALFYQIGCGPPKSVGEVLCLSGTGPHIITFCKPGNNINKYCITSIAKAEAGPPIAVNDGCRGELYSTGFVDTSITWRSVFPGAPGAYNSYLNCLKGCDTVQVTASPGFPAYVDFEVCGRTVGDCDPPPLCDTVRAYFNSTLGATILPLNPTVCFGNPHTTISANGSGGTPPYTYQWSTLATTQNINVNVGTYIVELGDSSGCPPTYDTVTVTSFANTIQANPGQDSVICQDFFPFALNGSIIAAAGGEWIGGTGTFTPNRQTLNATYLPSAVEITAGIVNLSLRTTGNGSCPPDTDAVRFEIPSFVANYTTSFKNVSCFGGNNGIIKVTGTAIDSISWDTSITSYTVDSALNLISDTFLVRIVDTNGCYVDTNIFINQPTELKIDSAYSDSVFCFGDTSGKATVFATGGTIPYTYAWSANTNGQTNRIALNLIAGIYQVTISDANKCTNDTVITVFQKDSLSLQAGSFSTLCYGDSSGKAFIAAKGGNAPYVYSWNKFGLSVLGDTLFGLPSDTFTVRISDNKGCFKDTSIIVLQPVPIVIAQVDSSNLKCYGDGSGFIKIGANGGVGNYSYNWSAIGVPMASDSAVGLAAGTYSVTVSDSNNCIIDTTIVLMQPDSVIINLLSDLALCFGDANGKITAMVSGGTPSYNYSWSRTTTGQTPDTLIQLPIGTYRVTVTDANSCIKIDSIAVLQPDSLKATLNKKDVTCFDGTDGWISVSAAGGSIPYSYNWSGTPFGQGTDSIFELAATQHFITITDKNSCQFIISEVLTEPQKIVSSLTNIGSDTLCIGSSVTLRTNPIGGSGGYQFNWSSGDVTDTIFKSPNITTTYRVTITDINNCPGDTDEITIYVIDVAGDTLIITNTGPVCFGKSVSVETFHSGKIPPYTYTWLPNIFTGISPHSYIPQNTQFLKLRTTDACANSREDSIQVTVHPLPQLGLPDTGYKGCEPLEVEFINAKDLSGQYTYQWRFGDGTSSVTKRPTKVFPLAGVYPIEVLLTSDKGCELLSKGVHQVEVFPKPAAEITSDKIKATVKTAFFLLEDISTGGEIRIWSLLDSILGTDVEQNISFNDTGTYVVSLISISENKCKDTSTFSLLVGPDHNIVTPTAFTPNKSSPGDGGYNRDAPTNQVFFPFTDYVDEYHFMIFNRWGELIFESFDVNYGWNGYYKGELSQQDVYFWKVQATYTDGIQKTLTGDVTLLH